MHQLKNVQRSQRSLALWIYISSVPFTRLSFYSVIFETIVTIVLSAVLAITKQAAVNTLVKRHSICRMEDAVAYKILKC